DVRGFTNFAEATAPEEVTRRLNGIFDCLGDPVRAAGGEILKFLGDGALAVFLPPDGANVAGGRPAGLWVGRRALRRGAGGQAARGGGAGHRGAHLKFGAPRGKRTYGKKGAARPPRLHRHRPRRE